MLELEHHRKLASIRIAVQFGAFNICAPCLSYCDQISLLECFPAQFLNKLMESRSVVCDLLIRLLGNLIDHIQTESTRSFFHPPEDHIIDLTAHFWILPVQIRLFYRKLVEIVLFQFRHPFPGRSPKYGSHIIRIHALFPISPDIIVMVRVILAFLCLLKPAMLIRRMV